MTFAITLRFAREAGFLSNLINRGTSDMGWSHVGAMTPHNYGPHVPIGFAGYMEFGARARADRSITGRPGMQLRPFDYAVFTHQAEVMIPVTEAEFAGFWSLARTINGAPYSWRTILGFAIGENVPEDGSPAFDCSTGMGWLLLHGAKILAPALKDRLRQISPNVLYGLATQLAYDRGLLMRATMPAAAG